MLVVIRTNSNWLRCADYLGSVVFALILWVCGCHGLKNVIVSHDIYIAQYCIPRRASHVAHRKHCKP